jgi:hypothetical protein
MRRRKFTIFHLLLAILVIALALASFVEQRTTVGQFKSLSPDGNWALDLKLTEYTTLFSSRKMVTTDLDHTTDEKSIWAVTHWISLDDANGKTISFPNAAALNIVYRKNDDDSLSILVRWGEEGVERQVTIGADNVVGD